MGYQLNLCTASDEQINYLKKSPGYTKTFLAGQRPQITKTETIGSWFSKREVIKKIDADVGCPWPEIEAEYTTLYFQGGLYFTLNGTHSAVEGLGNFPNVGGQYRGEMLGSAFELGEVGLGFAHAFQSAQVTELRELLLALDPETVQERARAYAHETEQDEDDAIQDALSDISSLHRFLQHACDEKLGMIWFWG